MLCFLRIIKPVCAWEGGRLFTCDTEFPLGRFCLSSLVSSHFPLSALEGRAFGLVASGRLRCISAKAVGSRRGKATDDSDWAHPGLVSLTPPAAVPGCGLHVPEVPPAALLWCVSVLFSVNLMGNYMLIQRTLICSIPRDSLSYYQDPIPKWHIWPVVNF